MKKIYSDFVRLGCALSFAIALLSGCGGRSVKTAVPSSSGPVSGSTAIVPGTTTPPLPAQKTDGGVNSLPETAIKPVAQTMASRFTEVSPSTTDDRTFQSSAAIEYDLGRMFAQFGGDNSVIVTPVKGWVRYPLSSTTLAASPRKYPVVVFEHGNHDKTRPSYQGYDYLAQNLAEHGYVVISIDANAINPGDRSSQSRAQLLLGTLDRLREIDRRGQVDPNGNPGALDPLQGMLDFTRIGIMGHSRGGQGISNAIKFNLTRRGVSENDLIQTLKGNPDYFKTDFPDLVKALTPAKGTRPATVDTRLLEQAVTEYNIFYAAGAESAPPYDFRAALMLAPTDFSGNEGLVNVPLAVLLASCDGDMSDLEGSRAFDHNRFSSERDTAPRFQLMVRGANHNFYNTIWAADGDDDAGDAPNAEAYCGTRPGGVRLSAEDQRRGGLFIINSFMRYFVGDEQQFGPYWNGTASLPGVACPNGKGSCDERVILTVQKDASHRKLIQRFEDNDSLRSNLLGGIFALDGFDEVARCDMPYGDDSSAVTCTPGRLDGFEYEGWSGNGYGTASNGLLSIADQLQLSWTKPGANVALDLKDLSAGDLDSLTFRIGIVRPMGQEVAVTFTDMQGHSASVNASDFSDALYKAPKPKGASRPLVDDAEDLPFANGAPTELLNMVVIPLAAFSGIDPKNLSQLKLAFPKDSGKVALADIELQNLAR